MADPDPSIAPRPDPARAMRAILLFAGGLSLILAITWVIRSQSSRTNVAGRSDPVRASRADYLGSRACSDCHPSEFAAHSRSGHAHTLRLAARTQVARRLDGATFPDPERPGTTWTYTLRDGQLTTERREAEEVERLVIEYAFGSGHHATTFVSLTDRASGRPMLIEHRLTAFAHKDVPDITPGQDLATGPNKPGMIPSGRRFGTAMALKCFECHTTVMSDRGPSVLDEATMIPDVGCERCHGPGRAHVQAARRGAGESDLAMPFGLGNWTTADEFRLCGACHRLPEMGDRAVIRPDTNWLVRFQPIGLMQSACYRQSQGGLSCTTCHDPHARTSTDLAAYEAVCLSCHRGPLKTPCKVSPATGCIACHMPRRDAARGMMMTDHWIRSRPEAAVNAPPTDREHLTVDPSGTTRAIRQ